MQPVVSVGDSAGSTGSTRMEESRSRRNFPTPITVPPVPTPATKALRALADGKKLRPDFGAGGFGVGLGVGGIRKLARKEDAIGSGGELFATADAAAKAAALLSGQICRQTVVRSRRT